MERRLTYPIKGQKKGLFYLTYFSSEGKNIVGIEHDVALNEMILRSLVVKIGKLADTMLAPRVMSMHWLCKWLRPTTTKRAAGAMATTTAPAAPAVTRIPRIRELLQEEWNLFPSLIKLQACFRLADRCILCRLIGLRCKASS